MTGVGTILPLLQMWKTSFEGNRLEVWFFFCFVRFPGVEIFSFFFICVKEHGYSDHRSHTVDNNELYRDPHLKGALRSFREICEL